MKTWLCWLVGLAAVCTAVAVGSTSQAADDELPPALDELKSCIARERRFDVMFVMDESASLGSAEEGRAGTDPEGRRSQGLQGAIDGLYRLSQKGAGGELTVNVMLAAFATDFSRVSGTDDNGFIRVGADTVEELRSTAAEFERRNDGDYTNFAAAFVGAIDAFAQQSAAETAQSCKAMVLFTDGKLDLPTGQGEVEARRDLCTDEVGLADQTRRNDIVTIGVQLTDDPTSTDDDAVLLERIAVGTDVNGTLCGVRGSDETGWYLPVTSGDELAQRLADLFEDVPIETTTTTTVPPIPDNCTTDQPCRGTFELQRAATGFHLTATTSVTGAVLTITAPDGSSGAFTGSDATSLALGGSSTIEYRSTSAGGFDLSAATSSADAGTWSWDVEYPADSGEASDPVVATALFADIAPVSVTRPELVAGDVTEVEIRLAGIEEQPELADGASLTVSVDGRTEEVLVTSSGTGTWIAQVPVASNESDTKLDLSYLADVPAADELGLPVDRGGDTLDVRFVGIPQVRPTELLLPKVEGTGVSTGILDVVAPASTGGCAWVLPGTIDAPRAGETITYRSPNSSEAGCLRVGPGQTRQLTVDFAVDEKYLGSGSGYIEVRVTSDDPVIEPRTFRVETLLPLTPSTGWAWWVIAGFVLGFILLALAILHAVAWWFARFPPESHLAYWIGQVRVSDGDMVTLRGDRLRAVSPEGLIQVGPRPVRRRRVRCGSFELRVRPISLFRPSLSALLNGPTAHAVFMAPNGRTSPVEGNNVNPIKVRHRTSDTEAPVLLSAARTWVFAFDHVDTDNNDVIGQLLIVVGQVGAHSDDTGRTIDAARRTLTNRVGAYRKAANDSVPTANLDDAARTTSRAQESDDVRGGGWD